MVGKLIVTMYGIVNVIAAAYIFFSFPLPVILKISIVMVLLIKGIPSFAGDFLCKIDAVVDVIAALAIAGFFIIPSPLTLIIALMLVWVAMLSFL